MSDHTRRLAAAVAIAVTIGVLPAAAASAADTAAPTVTAQPRAAIVKGSILTTNLWGDVTDPFWYSNLPVKLSWSATDPSGICGYSLWQQPAGSEPTALFENRMLTSYTVTSDEYDGSFGGGSFAIVSWFVTATDCAGNTSAAVTIPSTIEVIQDDNTTSLIPRGAFAYTGTWSSSSCTCWSGLTTRKTTEKNAAVTFTGTFSKGSWAGLVMATGPDRGKAQIWVDGVLMTSIDTYSATKVNRKVVWSRKIGAGTHTIKVVNLATTGRPRIDLDAIVLT